MPTRFDHAVIAVRDLESALNRFRHLGFDAVPGGRHTGRGTHNALIRFGLDYVELLSVYDEAEARAFSPNRLTLLDSLNDREAALVGYALATNTIEQDAQRFKGFDEVAPQPNTMERKRPDGNTLSWRTLSPGGFSWNRPWPFLIQWDTPDEQRLQIDKPGVHPNGVTGWIRVAVATQDLERTLNVYQNQLGLELIRRDLDPSLSAQRAVLAIGKGTIDLLAPDGAGSVQHILTEKGEGPFALTFTVKDLEQTHAFLQQREIAFEQASADGKLIIAPQEASGIRITLQA